MKLDLAIKRKNMFAEQVHNVYANAARFCWTADFVNKGISEIYSSNEYRAMPQWCKHFVEGVRHHCDFLHWKLVVFSYEIHGKRLVLGTEAYRKVDPCYVSKHCSETGCFVYRDNPDKLFTQPKS